MSSNTTDRIENMARDAGERVAYANEALRDLIKTLVQEGATDYAASEHKLARKIFAETLAAKGRTKNGGITQYANAWDELRDSNPSLGMGERARKGAGGRRTSAATVDADASDTASESAAPAQPTMTNREAIDAARPYIQADAIMSHLAKHGLTFERLEEFARDAGDVVKASKKIKDKAAKDAIKSAIFVIQEIGKSIQACVDESDSLAVERGLKKARVPRNSPAKGAAKEPENMSADELAAEINDGEAPAEAATA